jgi:hypothetical protein
MDRLAQSLFDSMDAAARLRGDGPGSVPRLVRQMSRSIAPP